MKRLMLLLALAACGPDETISAFGNEDDYVLQDLNGEIVTVPITLNISAPGQISGQGPCNSYSAAQTAPYPWFALGPILSTKRACSDLALEETFFATLASMTIAEAAENVLILSNEAKETLTFQSP